MGETPENPLDHSPCPASEMKSTGWSLGSGFRNTGVPQKTKKPFGQLGKMKTPKTWRFSIVSKGGMFFGKSPSIRGKSYWKCPLLVELSRSNDMRVVVVILVQNVCLETHHIGASAWGMFFSSNPWVVPYLSFFFLKPFWKGAPMLTAFIFFGKGLHHTQERGLCQG